MKEDKDLTEFEEASKRALMSFLASKGMKMTDLLLVLQANSVDEKYGSLAARINRGKFSHGWLQKILRLLGYEVNIVKDETLDERIEVIDHIKDRHGLMIGHNQAERLIKAAKKSKIPAELKVEGLDTATGQPCKKVISTSGILEILDL